MGAQIQITILAFDDDASFLRQLKESLSAEYSVETATSIPQAMKIVMTRHLDLILLDMNMPEMSGLEFLKTLRQRNHNTPVIMLTGETKTETVVATIQAGAVDYVVKGTEDFIVNLSFRISQALKIKNLIKDNAILSRKVASDSARFEIVGISTNITKLRSEFLKFKNSHSTVLITGENGTGKELIARNLNLQEKNPARPFIAVNCGAIPENLFESELFGHKKGSFTGAMLDKAGLFALADGGDIFLDEIGELPLNMQVKLLRVLQEKIITPVGETKPVPVDVRVIAATNRNLEEMVKAKTFREDLYFRLNTLRLHTPALRERKEDILILAKRFAEKLHPKVAFSPEARKALENHLWPGNIRELQNVIERALLNAESGKRFIIEIEDIQISDAELKENYPNIPNGLLPSAVAEVTATSLDSSLNWMERVFLKRCLRLVNGDNRKLIDLLGLSRAHYYRRKKELAFDEETEQHPC